MCIIAAHFTRHAMPRKPSTLENFRLCLEVLKRIPRIGRTSAPDLLAQLTAMGIHRDLRSIQRLLDGLSEQLPIDRDERSKPFGYRWKERAQGITLAGLTRQESLMLILANQQLRSVLPASIMRTMAPFFEQARTNLQHGGAQDLHRQWLEKIRVVSPSQPLLPPEIKPGVLDTVTEALFHNHWLDIRYINAIEKMSDIRAMPLGLAQQGPNLFLVVRYEGFENERNLALHRIQKALNTGLPFDRPATFDMSAYEQAGGFHFGTGKLIRLRFLIDHPQGKHLLESRLSLDQRVKDLDTKFEITASVIESDQLIWWLRGFGKHVTVLSPKSVRNCLHEQDS